MASRANAGREDDYLNGTVRDDGDRAHGPVTPIRPARECGTGGRRPMTTAPTGALPADERVRIRQWRARGEPQRV